MDEKNGDAIATDGGLKKSKEESVMFLNKRKTLSEKEMKARISSLQAQREETKTNIRRLWGEMQVLVNQAVGADDLDKQIYASDYIARKDAFNAENEHFQNLSRLISQLQSMLLTQEKKEVFSAVSAISNQIDLNSLMEEQDRMHIQQDMLREEDQSFLEAFRASEPSAQQATREEKEFDALVLQAQADKAMQLQGAAPALGQNSQSLPAYQQ